MPGDPMQRLVTPNLFRIRKGFKGLDPNIVVSSHQDLSTAWTGSAKLLKNLS